MGFEFKSEKGGISAGARKKKRSHVDAAAVFFESFIRFPSRLRLCLVSQISPPSLMPGVVSGQDGGKGSDYAADASISAPLG